MIFSIFASKHLIERSTVHVDGRTNWKNKPMKRDLTWPWPIMIIMFNLVYKNLEILLSTLFFSSRALMVTGRVAELEAVPKAVTIALPMFAMNLGEKICVTCKLNLKKYRETKREISKTKFYLKGRDRVIRPKRIGRTRQPWIKRPRRTVKK